MPLNYKNISAAVKPIAQTNSNSSKAAAWMSAFKSSYDTDACAGTPSVLSVSIVPQAGLLHFDNESYSSSASNMGTAIANYWAAQLTPGVPATYGISIVSVTNDASKIGPLITTDLLSMASSGTERTPHFDEVFQMIENHVKTIVWTVVELMPGPTGPVPAPPYPVTIS